jgi:predicted AlkP superfamily phosphohydrolase/phosphomutase
VITEANSTTRNKIMIIGIDGATFRIIDPLVRRGELPALGRLTEEGTRGILRSTLHPLSPPAWASFMTGMNPGKHGIFDFIAREPTSYAFRPVNGSYLGARTLWSLLGEAGKRVGIINVPMTYPPEPVNGFLISGMDSPRLDRAYSFPSALSKEIDEACGGYIVDCSTQGPKGLSREEMTDLYTQRLLQVTRKRGSVARYLWQKYTPDFFMVVFGAADRVQHAVGEAIDGFGEGESSWLSDCITETYRHIDREIGDLLDQIDESWTVMIVSDHGASSYDRVLNLTYWLVENGFLHLSGGRADGTLMNWVERARHKLLYSVGMEARQARSRISPLLHIIDWEKTKAYALGAFGSIFVNLKGREPCGPVEPGTEYEDLCQEISERLLEARDPTSGTRLVEAVYRGQHVYNGDYLGHAPDLLVVPGADYFVRNSLDHYEWRLSYPAGTYGRRRMAHTGKHSREGVLIAWGSRINRGHQVQDARIVDVAPTVLYLLGEPIPHEMDGRILEGVIHPEYLAQNPPLFGHAEGVAIGRPGQRAYGEGEEREIEERLRGLGYLG